MHLVQDVSTHSPRDCREPDVSSRFVQLNIPPTTVNGSRILCKLGCTLIEISQLATPPKTNMSPENSGREITFLLKWPLFRGHVSFFSCIASKF